MTPHSSKRWEEGSGTHQWNWREADFASEDKLSNNGVGCLWGLCAQAQEWVFVGGFMVGFHLVIPHLLEGPIDDQQSLMPFMSERETKEVSGWMAARTGGRMEVGKNYPSG